MKSLNEAFVRCWAQNYYASDTHPSSVSGLYNDETPQAVFFPEWDHLEIDHYQFSDEGFTFWLELFHADGSEPTEELVPYNANGDCLRARHWHGHIDGLPVLITLYGEYDFQPSPHAGGAA